MCSNQKPHKTALFVVSCLFVLLSSRVLYYRKKICNFDKIMTAQSKLLVMLGFNGAPKIDEIAVNNKASEIRKKASAISNKEKTAKLLQAITLIDLTSLNIDDTQETIERLSLKAIRPIDGLKFEQKEPLHTAAVCVHSERVQDAIDTLDNHHARSIYVATVAGDFPSGKLPFEVRLKDVEEAAQLEVDEIDVVIDRSLVLGHDWDELLNQLSLMREACSNKKMKTILSTGDLPSLSHVYKASIVAMAAGTDFIKSSTGKEAVNATIPVGIVMCQAIKEYRRLTGRKVGLKPAGGIKTADQALEWLTLVELELGDEWLNRASFRIGASSLLDDICEAINKSV